MKRSMFGRADDGATLVIVLIIVTVVSAVMAVVLSQADTSVRTTVAMRDQASANYAADAAAQAIITQIQNGTLDCATVAGTITNLGASASAAFYTPVQTADGPINAATLCAPDTVAGVTTTTTTTTTGSGVTLGGAANNLPNYALLAMAGAAASDYGIDFSLSANNKTMCIENGSVVSNTKINASGEFLGVRVSGTGSLSDCTTGSSTSASGVQLKIGAAAVGGCIGTNGVNFDPTFCTPATAIGLPSAPVPSDPITRTNAAATCLTSGGKKYAAFLPGKYTNVALLNSPCSGTVDFEWFSPGTYYFDFGSTTWSWPATMLAGTPMNAAGNAITTVNPTNAATLSGLANIAPFPASPTETPKSCADPTTQSTYPGVEFVFGGASTVTPMSGGNAEICANYNATSPPIAIYGAQTALTVPGGTVTAETLCTAAGCGSNSLINTDTNGQPQFYIKGFVYAPNAQVILTLKNSNGQIFNWGVVVRDFSLRVNGVSPTAAFIALPEPNQGVTTTTTTTTTYSIRYINVWTCTASDTPCAHTGPPTVRVKVQTNGSTTKVLSWSHQR